MANTFTFLLPQSTPTIDPSVNLKDQPRLIFIEGDQISFDIELYKGEINFSLEQWTATAIFGSMLRETIGIFSVFKFELDANRLRLVAEYRPEIAVTKGYYREIKESADFFVHIKLVKRSEIRNVIPVPIYLKRKGYD
jgi:hypothetical protein